MKNNKNTTKITSNVTDTYLVKEEEGRVCFSLGVVQSSKEGVKVLSSQVVARGVGLLLFLLFLLVFFGSGKGCICGLMTVQLSTEGVGLVRVRHQQLNPCQLRLPPPPPRQSNKRERKSVNYRRVRCEGEGGSKSSRVR